MKTSIRRTVTARFVLALVMAMAALSPSPRGTAQAEEKPAAGEEAKTLKLPTIFGDHMVLQRDGVSPIWGTANPGDRITVTVGAVSGAATTDANGKWIVRLEKLPISDTPIEVKVQGPKDTIVFTDVLVGDVWFASGQSNMELGISLINQHKTPPPIPLVRVFICAHQASATPTETIPRNQSMGRWKSDFGGGQWGMGVSAVGYYFVRDIAAYTKHPVALIQSAVSGSVAQTWVSREALQSEPSLSKYAEAALKAENISKQGEKQKISEMYGNAVNFNGCVNPYIPYGIKGVIWYQGESNSGNPKEYRTLLPAMIKDWRTRWGYDFPFLIVQLPTGVPAMNQAQAYVAAMPHNGMCVTYDIGAGYSVPKGNSRVHPFYKSGIGSRLALAAEKVAYGDDKAVSSGPTCKNIAFEGNKVRVTFDNIGSGLKIGVPPEDWYPNEPRVSTDALLGFYVAGKDGKFQPATATIEGNTVVASSPEVPNPTLVRYGWYDLEKGRNNLYNKEGLPAVPFTSAEMIPLDGGTIEKGRSPM